MALLPMSSDPFALPSDRDMLPSERREFVDYAGGSPMHAPLAYHWTRMIEMLHSLEVVADLLQPGGRLFVRDGHPVLNALLPAVVGATLAAAAAVLFAG